MNPLGTRAPHLGPEPRAVIGALELSPSGNLVLRVGREHGPRLGWEQTEHVVLELGEAGLLVREIMRLYSGGVELEREGPGQVALAAIDLLRGQAGEPPFNDDALEEQIAILELRLANATDRRGA